MTAKEFCNLMDQEDKGINRTGDNAFKGLQILSKYTDDLVCTAEHDIIYSEDVDVLLEAGITEDDAKKLRDLNWMIDEDCLACFV